MSKGVIDGFAEVRQWTIPDFFSIEEYYVDSPQFSLAGSTWILKVYLRGAFLGKRHVSVYLVNGDTNIPAVRASYAIGFKRADGTVEEKVFVPNKIFDSSSDIGWPTFWPIDDLQKRRSELAPSDALTISVRIMVTEAATVREVATNPEEVESRSRETTGLETLSSDLKELLSSGKNCDVTLIVQGKEFRAHRALLSARSSVLRAMYEHDTSEAESGIATIPDVDRETFGDFLDYLYTGKIPDMSFRAAYELYITSDKYDVQRLKDSCTSRLKQNLSAENVCDVAVLGDRFGDDILTSSAQAYFNKNWRKVFLTSEWTTLTKNNLRLANKLTKELASAT